MRSRNGVGCDMRLRIGAPSDPGPHRQSTVTTSIGSEMPLTVTVRRPSSGNCPPAAVSALATICPPSGEPADPGGFVHSLAGEVPSDHRRVGGVHADPHLRREPGAAAMFGEPPLDRGRACERIVGNSNATKNPSPVAVTSSPRFAPNIARRVLSCQDRSDCASSPIASRRLVDPTMSVNMKVRWTRWVGARPRSCHGSSSATSSRTIARVGQASAASRSFSSSTLAASATPAFAKSPRCQSKPSGRS